MKDNYLKAYKYQSYEELKQAIADYNRLNPDNEVTNLKKYRIWSRQYGAPTTPASTYKVKNFDLKDLLGTKITLEATIKFFRDNGVKSSHHLRTLVANKELVVPKNVTTTTKILSKIGFDWNIYMQKKKRGNWAPMQEAVIFYQSLIEKHNLTNIGRQIRKLDIPSDIPKEPVCVYDGFSWSLVTGKSNGIKEARENRIELARLIRSNIDLIDTLDDTLVAILLAKLYDKVDLTELIKSKVKSIVKKAIDSKPQGDRKEILNEVAKTIEEADNFDELECEDTEDVELIDNQETEQLQSTEEVVMTIDYEQRLKKVVKVTNDNILNEDLDVDVKNLMIKNGIKALWYLECQK